MPILVVFIALSSLAVAVDQLTSDDFSSSWTGAVFAWFLQEMGKAGSQFIDWVFQQVPSGHDGNYDLLITYAAYITYWIPVDLLMVLAAAWLVFQFAVIAIRWVMKAIPGIG